MMTDSINTYMFRVWAGGLFLLLTVQLSPLFAQDATDFSFLEISEDANKRYGPSPNLLNGEKYHYPYRSARGNPFFEVKGDADASVQINGRLFEKQKIKYDIYNQLIVLDFIDRSGAPGSIVLRNEWLETLIIDGFQFKKYPDENGLERFGQVIHEDNFSCVYFWEKEYTPDLQYGEKSYRFSDPKRQAYILTHGHFSPYSGRGSLLKCFPKPIQLQIKTYLKENRIRIRKVDDLQMQSLMVYINQLSNDED